MIALIHVFCYNRNAYLFSNLSMTETPTLRDTPESNADHAPGDRTDSLRQETGEAVRAVEEADQRIEDVLQGYLTAREELWREAAGQSDRPRLSSIDREYATREPARQMYYAAEKKGLDAWARTRKVPQDGPIRISGDGDEKNETRVADAAITAAYYRPERIESIVERLDQLWQETRKTLDPLVLQKYGKDGLYRCGLEDWPKHTPPRSDLRIG